MSAQDQSLTGARELLDIEVEEVSLVDHPANRRRFLALKRKENLEMGAFDTRTAVNKNEDKVATEKAAAEKAEKLKKAADLEKAIAEMEKCGGDVTKAKDQLAELKKAAGDGQPGGAAAAAPPKVEEDPEVKKAHEEIVAASKSLTGVVGDLSKAVEGISKLLTSNPNFTSQVHAEGTKQPEIPRLMKAVEDVQKSVDTAQKALTENTTRLEKIEKARAAPTSETPAGGTDGDPNRVETKKSLWGNLGLLGTK